MPDKYSLAILGPTFYPPDCAAVEQPRSDRRTMVRYCVFCEIVAKREPAEILYETENVLVFRNVLRWVPIMLLAIPKQHTTQADLWSNMGEVGEAAIKVAREQCPGGFRLISNSGYDGMQSQEHAHVHILGGMFLGEYA